MLDVGGRYAGDLIGIVPAPEGRAGLCQAAHQHAGERLAIFLQTLATDDRVALDVFQIAVAQGRLDNHAHAQIERVADIAGRRLRHQRREQGRRGNAALGAGVLQLFVEFSGGDVARTMAQQRGADVWRGDPVGMREGE